MQEEITSIEIFLDVEKANLSKKSRSFLDNHVECLKKILE